MTNPIWFKAKRYGWGWYPATWQGWLIILVWLGAVIWILPRLGGYKLPDGNLVVNVGRLFILMIPLIIVLYLFGEKPGWHWGDK